MAWKAIDLTGHRYGKLVVIRKNGYAKRAAGFRAQWLCRCDCGNLKTIVGMDLRKTKGGTKSCGCLVRSPEGEAAFRKMYYRMYKQAMQRGYKWNLTENQVREITSSPCHYCGKSPQQVSGEYTNAFNGVYLYNGIDRVDNTKGYTGNNVVPCCKTCNHAKSSLPIDDFREWILSVYNHWLVSSDI